MSDPNATQTVYDGLAGLRPPAPQKRFADLVEFFKPFAEDGHEDDVVLPHESVVVLLACIREQQAALAGVIRVADRATLRAAWAALEKWRIE